MIIDFPVTPFDDLLYDISRNKSKKVIPALKAILNKSLEDNLQPDVLSYIFANALLKRLRHEVDADKIHPLLAQLTQSFRLMPQMQIKLPLLLLVADTINQLILEECKQLEELTLFDTSVMDFEKIKELLTQIDAKKLPLRKITIVNFLSIRQDSVEELQAELQVKVPNIPLQFVAIKKHIAELTKQEWRYLQTTYRKGVLIYSTFGVPFHKPYSKNKIINEFKQFHKPILIFTDPNTNYAEENIIRRFYNAWQYVNLSFRYVEALNLNPNTTIMIKMYFKTLLEKVLGTSDFDKARLLYEATEVWADRFSLARFIIADSIPLSLPQKHDILTINQRNGYVSFDFDGGSLIGLILAKA